MYKKRIFFSLQIYLFFFFLFNSIVQKWRTKQIRPTYRRALQYYVERAKENKVRPPLLRDTRAHGFREGEPTKRVCTFSP
jgi:hypothetical protein